MAKSHRQKVKRCQRVPLRKDCTRFRSVGTPEKCNAYLENDDARDGARPRRRCGEAQLPVRREDAERSNGRGGDRVVASRARERERYTRRRQVLGFGLGSRFSHPVFPAAAD
ncbi:hypothetical protein MRX96_026470 [Rhipicephalus microplus]